VFEGCPGKRNWLGKHHDMSESPLGPKDSQVLINAVTGQLDFGQKALVGVSGASIDSAFARVPS
jgi:hypothetical protein